MKRLSLLLFALALAFIVPSQANATTYTYADNWVDWPGYTSSLIDEHGTPKIDHMDVVINKNNNDYTLGTVSIVLHDSQGRQAFDSLFISTDGDWDSWDYFVHDGGASHSGSTYTSGTVPDDGLYSVASNYTYTYANTNRVGNPNGIEKDSLTSIDSNFGATQDSYTIKYDFTTLANSITINPNEFFIAYAPWCDNDIIGGGTAPVPEPATMLLFGAGLIGFATISRKKLKRN